MRNINNETQVRLCFDTLSKNENSAFNFGLFFCQKSASASQVTVNEHSGLCIDISGVRSGDIVKLQKCNAGIPEQLWTFANYLST